MATAKDDASSATRRIAVLSRASNRDARHPQDETIGRSLQCFSRAYHRTALSRRLHACPCADEHRRDRRGSQSHRPQRCRAVAGSRKGYPSRHSYGGHDRRSEHGTRKMTSAPNTSLLASSSRREQRQLLVLSMPALILIGIVCAMPVLCLFWLSFVGPEGLTLRNYARIVENPSYLAIFRNTFLA